MSMRRTMTRRLRQPAWAVLLLAGVTLVAACSLAAPRNEPEMHIHFLNPDEPADSTTDRADKKEGNATLLVSLPQAQAGFETARMAYLLRAHEIRYFAVHQWADTPGRMLTPLLRRALEKADDWRAVVQAPAAVRSDFRLDADQLALLQDFTTRPSRVRLILRVQLVDLKGQQVIGARRFEAVEAAPSDDPYGGVEAASRALSKLLDQVTTWLSGCMKKTPSAC
ncbi:MAG: hypothetical protein EPO61_10960 [Nitrospirae bacterium]|nr:MAG: hypothetical protein EPO61_10960 [Nitrospirota bacterium]